jgi:chemotaxis-related protein WspD
MSTLSPVLNVLADCWNRIGVAGDRSCPELVPYVHCHNCPVFAAAGQRLLDSPPPPSYLDEARERLASAPESAAGESYSALVFRMGEEWLALPVQILVEVHPLRPVHRVPHRGGLLAGLVNIRGELQLCVRFDQLLGISTAGAHARSTDVKQRAEGSQPSTEQGNTAWLLVIDLDAQRWVLPVDEVDQVYRFPANQLTAIPATVARSSGRLSRGMFDWKERTIGYLDDTRLLQALRTRLMS